MGQGALELDGIGRRFGGLEAVRDVTLSVREGVRQAIIGPNGAGKTTLFNLITGELAPSSGRIHLFGRDVTGLPAHRRAAMGLARTFQITNLFGPLTVEENVLLAAQALEVTKYVVTWPLGWYTRLHERARELLERAGLWEKRRAEVRALSYGEQRQLEVLLALAGSPRMLLLDEPAAGLSPGERREMARFIKGLDPGLTILMIEHDMDVAFEVAETMAVLHFGRLVAQGTNAAVRADPTVQEIYLGAGPADGGRGSA
ncbi:MAG: ABC transporter ATP-binding protein [Bacillati bacterium ANGP1]|uniref:ABC transporter ATP-binding protein n=1 Tax=Candidatus Segetimicrobium genomatis TaxID=2569760 RepID=A0A537J3N5_9BACT|nr:MAG: ABC transporter ATP-binding protein [Terrabacteria group bacterium ANGP1]